MMIFVQVLMAFFGSLGYGIIFRMKIERLVWGALGGAFTWIVYLSVMEFTPNVYIGFFVSTLFATIYAEVFARIKKAPATIFVLPAVVPLIPGSGLYYTFHYLMVGEISQFQQMGVRTVGLALSIAVGMLVVGVLWNLVEQILLFFRKK